MAFVQVIEFRSSQFDELEKVGDEWEEAAADQSTVSHRVLCQDRDDPGRYFNIVFFESYEEAMKNSELPVTQEFSARLAELVEGPPTFYNLDVLRDD